MISLFCEAAFISAVIIVIIVYFIAVVLSWIKFADWIGGLWLYPWEKFFVYLAIPLTIIGIFVMTVWLLLLK